MTEMSKAQMAIENLKYKTTSTNKKETTMTSKVTIPAVDADYIINAEVLNTMQAVTKAGGLRNILATGPSGCGKTDMARHLAASCKRPYYEAVVGQLVEALDLVGVKGVKDGSTFFKESQFVKAIETPNCVVCLDEINRAPSSVLNLLIPLLDHRGKFFVEELDREVEVSDGVVFFATANIGSEFSGTYRLDEALINRFSYRYEVDFLEMDQEAAMLESRTKCGTENSQMLARVASDLRSKAQGFGGTLSRTVSTRQMLQAAYLVAAGIGIHSAMDVCVVVYYDDEGGQNSERSQVLLNVDNVCGVRPQ
jgi:nitric oxide reductase NorQ protein